MESKDVAEILIVDDSSFNRKILEDSIISFGYSTRVVSDGKKALECLHNEKIDLILLDVMMPGIDGYELCTIIKSETRLAEIPVIFITGKNDSNDIARGFEVGGVDYISKPFNPIELRSRVKTHLELKRSLDKVKSYNEELISVTDSLFKANRTVTNKKLELEAAIKKLEDTELQLISKEKAAGIGELAAGVAHEINTPLGFIISNFDTMGKYVSKFKELISIYKNIETDTSLAAVLKKVKVFENQNHIDYIYEDVFQLLTDTKVGLERVRDIVAALKSFSNIDQIEKVAEYDFNEGIKNVLIIAQIEIMDYAIIKKNFGDMKIVLAVNSEINQAILNIINNSVYAIRSKGDCFKGIISISSYTEKDYVVCTIKDNGVGIEKSIINKVFDAFFTTKSKDGGSGLGLSVAHDIIVDKHKGKLLVESEVGNYTKITIKLPINL